MSAQREDRRRKARRRFQPGLEGGLESRFLLSTTKASAGGETVHQAAIVNGKPVGNVITLVAGHGTVARIDDIDGEIYDVVLTGPGRVRATPMKGGKVKIIIDGSTSATDVTINPVSPIRHKGDAHEFPVRAKFHDGVLHVGEIDVTSGNIDSILGYRTADLSGPLIALSPAGVDRLAFNELDPGATIVVGQFSQSGVPGSSGMGDLNTLNVFTTANLSGAGTGIFVGRDLNWFSVAGDLNINDGAQVLVGRDLGLIAQPAKGTDTGGIGTLVQGDLNVGPGSSFVVDGISNAGIFVRGQATGTSRVFLNPDNLVALGGSTP